MNPWDNDCLQKRVATHLVSVFKSTKRPVPAFWRHIAFVGILDACFSTKEQSAANQTHKSKIRPEKEGERRNLAY